MARFKGRAAFITGAAQGMGQRVALDMAEEGASVAVTDIDEERLEETAGRLDAIKANFLAFRCDVSKDGDVQSAVNKTVDHFGSLDILINNAGLLRCAAIEETSNELIDATVDINIKGLLYTIRSAAPIMKNQKYGKIVNVASITGKNGDNSTTFVYGASKGAVITMTRSVARQLGSWGVNCNAIAPHAVMTKMMEYWSDEKKSAMAEKIPLKRLGTVQDMSNLMMFLASDESSFITGEVININGGYYMD